MAMRLNFAARFWLRPSVSVMRREQRHAVRNFDDASRHLRGWAGFLQRARPATVVVDLVGQVAQISLGCTHVADKQQNRTRQIVAILGQHPLHDAQPGIFVAV